jgi:hypothetical protein
MGFFKKFGQKIEHGLFGRPAQNPAEAAMPYLNQIPEFGRQGYQPFIDQGQQAQQQLNPLYERMSQDPTAYINALMQNYSPSEGYRFKEQQMLRGAQNSAASGGFAGTQNDQMAQAEMIRGLLGGDMQQFLQNVMGAQGQGMQGLENQVGRGYESAGNLAGYLGNALGAQGGAAFQGQQQKNENSMGKRNSFLNFLGNLAGAASGAYAANKQYGG